MDFKTIIDEHYRREDAVKAALEPKAEIAHSFIKHVNESFDKIWECVARNINKEGIAPFDIGYPVGIATGRAKITARDRIDVDVHFTNFISEENFVEHDYENVFLWIEHFYYSLLPGQDTSLVVSPLDNGFAVKYRFKAK